MEKANHSLSSQLPTNSLLQAIAKGAIAKAVYVSKVAKKEIKLTKLQHMVRNRGKARRCFNSPKECLPCHAALAAGCPHSPRSHSEALPKQQRETANEIDGIG